MCGVPLVGTLTAIYVPHERRTCHAASSPDECSSGHTCPQPQTQTRTNTRTGGWANADLQVFHAQTTNKACCKAQCPSSSLPNAPKQSINLAAVLALHAQSKRNRTNTVSRTVPLQACGLAHEGTAPHPIESSGAATSTLHQTPRCGA